MLTTVLQVALGGAIGAGGRYLVNTALMRFLGPGFPWGTVAVNVVGSFCMGVLVVVLAKRGGLAATPFLMTGVLGGFTTFSAFSLDAITLADRGQIAAATAYVAGSVVLSIGALSLGMLLARNLA